MANIVPNAPWYRDPIYDGCSDPAIIWNRQEKSWWLLYTQRRATDLNIQESYAHGSAIGVASSKDGGASWLYRGTLDLSIEPGHNTFWSPEVVYHNGMYYMYVQYIQGVPVTWFDEGKYPRSTLLYTSNDLWNWRFEKKIELNTTRSIDATVCRLPDGRYKMWYKDEDHESHGYAAVSSDLFNWEVIGPEITDCAHEGPNVFFWKNYYWMVIDQWHGLGVFRSDDAYHWERKKNILQEGGNRTMDGVTAAHADIQICGERAFIVYFTHPYIDEEERNSEDFSWGQYPHNSCVTQVAELGFDGDGLTCDRDNVEIELIPPEGDDI